MNTTEIMCNFSFQLTDLWQLKIHPKSTQSLFYTPSNIFQIINTDDSCVLQKIDIQSGAQTDLFETKGKILDNLPINHEHLSQLLNDETSFLTPTSVHGLVISNNFFIYYCRSQLT